MKRVAIYLLVLLSLVKLSSAACYSCTAGYNCDNYCGLSSACDTGWYNVGGSSLSCSPCPKGYYCPNKAGAVPCPPDRPFSYLGGGQCLPCPAGWACAPGTAPSVCSDGTYALSGAGTCTACPKGFRCPDKTAAPVACPAGYFSLGSAMSCTPCSPGQYCPTTTSAALSCPSGTYSGFAQQACTVCPAGSYCPRTDLTTPLLCLAGEYSLPGSTSCTRCEAGKQCPNTNKPGTDCPAGYYSLSGQTACTACPAGYYCKDRDKVPSTLCGTGTYSLAGATYCLPCPVGQACPYTYTSSTGNCPANYYQLGNVIGYCKQCEPGYECTTTGLRRKCGAGYYSIGMSTCTICGAGKYCPFTTRGPLDCPAGTYCPQGSVAFIFCPAGKYCSSVSGLPADCAAGTYSLGKQTSCTTCPDGFYCPSTSAPPLLCPLGYYTTGTGATSCTKCPLGSYCPGTTSNQVKTPPAGTYVAEGMSYYIPCLPGFYCPSATSAPVKCDPGTYSSFKQATACTNCEAGYACPTTTDLDKYACPAGTYSLGSATYCDICPAGMSCATNKDPPVACPSGQFSQAGATTCTSCPSGFYCPYPNAPHALPCPPGTYSGADQTECTVCSPGTSCYLRTGPTTCSAPTSFANSGSHLCAPCPGGSGCTGGISSPCGPGYYSPAGDDVCHICTAGSYCPTGTSNPIPCPAGTESTADGNTVCTACATGYYSAEGAKNCVQCPAGSYCPAPHISPRVCPPGTFSAAGSYMCKPCTPGKYCPAGTTDTTLQPCPTGYYCNYVSAMGFGGVGKIPCPAGNYRGTTGATAVTDCAACPAGKYCEEGTTTPASCPKGHICPSGTMFPNQFPCPPGTYNSANDKSTGTDCVQCTAAFYCPAGCPDPIPCPPGYYCPLGTGYLTNLLFMPAGKYTDLLARSGTGGTTPDCPQGYYCPVGTVFPIPCPPGTYRDTTAAKSKADCAKCLPGTACPKYANTASTSGVTCPKGYYCPEGTEYPREYPCPPGTYNDATGKSLLIHCLDCPAGKACDGGTNEDTNPAKRCQPGYYCPLGSATPKQVPCPAGKYLPTYDNADASTAITCDEGYYCIAGSDRVTAECPEGYYCTPGTEYPTQHPCPLGTYSNLRRLKLSSDCTACPVGYYCPAASTAPLPCPAGTYNNLLNKGTFADCLACTAGYYCPQATPDRIPCGKGKYSPTGARQCFECLPGKYCNSDTTANTAMGSCGAGYYCPRGTGEYPSAAVTCPAGYYCPINSDRPIKCPPGQISDPQSASCTSTAAGNYTVLGSGTATGQCKPGYYCPTGSWSNTTIVCPAGTFRDSPGAGVVGDCAQCPVNYYCPEATYIPVLCPQGYYCPAGSPLPLKCPAGTYGSRFGLADSTECTKCPAGTYCSIPGLAAPEGLCDAGYFCIEGANISTPIDGTTGNICPAGGFCEAGSRTSKSCPPGRYNPGQGGRDLDACVLCPPGKYCSGEAKAIPTGDCDPGYYCPTGSYMKNMQPAPPGYNTSVGQASPTPCAEGLYNPYYAQSTCLPCPAGFLCKGTANTGTFINCYAGNYCPIQSVIPTPCPKGTYNPNLNGKSIDDCLPCPAGKFCAMEGLDKPGDGTNPDSDCAPGYYCKTRAESRVPIAVNTVGFGPCPAGYYCPKGISNPLPCPPGTYSDATLLYDSSQCKPCPAGYYCAAGGLAAQEGLCGQGYFCPQGSKVPKDPANICPVGTYCPEGSAVSTACDQGTYQDEQGQGSCKTCPDGYYCPTGTSSLTGKDCPEGYYCPAGTASANQFPCPIGRYNPRKNARLLTDCLLCDPGYYCLGTAQKTPTGQCTAGYYCKLGSPTATPPSTAVGAPADHGDICPLGSYCPTGSASPILCPGGKYCSVTGLATNQGSCNAGYYCRLGSMSKTPTNLGAQGGEKCPAGHYCLAGSDSPTPCPPGTFSPNTGNTALSDCKPCTSGMYCQDAGAIVETNKCAAGYYCKVAAAATIGFTTPNPPSQLCPIGYYCQLGTVDKMACTNSFQDLQGQSSCKSCPAGYYCTSVAKFLCRPGLENLSYFCPADVMGKINCPLGTYTMADGASSNGDCIKCPPGNYCPVDATKAKIIPCQAGYYCRSLGASVATGDGLCPAGYYCPQGTQNPIECPAGKFCGVTGLTDSILTDTTKDCNAGYICYGKSVTPTPTDGINGNICPAGFYCPKGTKSPIACPIGYYRSLMGGKDQTDCAKCTVGYSCSSRGMSSPTPVCPPGYYCPLGSSQTTKYPCPVGARCPSGSSNYEVCPDKTYQNSPLSVDCLDCPARFYCKNSGVLATASKPVECPAGKYCPPRTDNPIDCPIATFSSRTGLASDSECDPCTPGFYCPTTGLTAATLKCDAGYYCSGGSKTKRPNDATGNVCSKGSYCQQGSAAPTPCPPGTFNDLVGMSALTDCVGCNAGYFCPLRGATSMDLKFGSSEFKCLDGFLCLGKATIPNPTDGTTGRMCTAGNYCPAGTTAEIPCERGYYNPDAGQKQCLVCPAGKLCPNSGMSTFNQCPAGYYCPAGSYQAVKCPAGTYSPFTDLESVDECVDCDPGKYCSGGLNATDGNCSAGYVCPKKSPVAFSYAIYSMAANTAGQCPMGYMCPEGSSAPTPCSPGTYNDQIGATSCSSCPPGKYCDELGLTGATKSCAAGHLCIGGAKHARPLNVATEGGRLCSAGYYCPEGTTIEKACPAGRFEPRAGSSQCQMCPAGYYCGSATVTPTPCPVNYYCPAGSSSPTLCPDGTFGRAGSDKLEREDQCMPCPSGKYCKMGVISGPCKAGYYCDVGASKDQDTSKLCPAGHYCLAGAKLPTRCDSGKFNMDVGAADSSACQDCTSGYYCIAGSPVPIACPVGHYCPPPASKPLACPKGTYQPDNLQISRSTCVYCPAGSYCYEEAVFDYTMYPCPVGHYCPAANSTNYMPIACPAMTYRNTTGAKSAKECLPCPGGHLCQEATVHPKPCQGGTYCNADVGQKGCPAKYYCPPASTAPIKCPAAYNCSVNSTIYEKCPDGTYCPEGTATPIPCPAGFIGSHNQMNINVSLGCAQCTPGYYSLPNTTLLECLPCTEGYVCLGGTKTDKPVNITEDGGQVCPVGFYCPAGTYKPNPCPQGKYNPDTMKASIDDCLPCPKGQFNPFFGASTCITCGESSVSAEDGLSCICKGKYRAYQVETKKCLCQPQYEPVDGSSDDDSTGDCQPMIFERCSSTQVRDPKGKCKEKNECPECPNGQGTRSPGIGVCECVKVDVLDNVCNDKCRSLTPKVSIAYNGDIAINDPTNPTGNYTIAQSEIPGFFGSVSSPTTNSKVASMSVGAGAGFSSNYQPTSSIANVYAKKSGRSRLLQSTADAGINNPIICLNMGDTMMFQLTSATDYPVYDKDNLLNSNPNFDYSTFVKLEQELAKGRNITDFGYTFTQPGRYVFKNKANPSQITIIGVMASNEKCSDPDRFIQPISTSSLLKLGVAQNEDIILSPDWGLIFGLITSILFGTPLLIGFIKYFSQSSWIKPRPAVIKYREVNKDADYDEFTSKGKEWKRDLLKPAEGDLLLPNGPSARAPTVLVDEDNPLIAKPNEREKQIIEMRKKENVEGVHEIPTDIFRDLYKELQYHAKFVKDEFARKAGLDSENIKKVFSEIDRLKLLMQDKLQNIAKSYGRGIRLIFDDKNENGEGLFVEHDEPEEEKKADQEKSVVSDSENEEKTEQKVEFKPEVLDEIDQRDQQKVDELAEKLRGEHTEIEQKLGSEEKAAREKFEQDIKGNAKLTPEEKKALLADYDKANAKLKKLLMVEEQSSEDKLQQMLEQRRKKRQQMQEEIAKMEGKKAEIQTDFEKKLQSIDAQKQAVNVGIDQDIEREKAEEIEKLESKRQQELQKVRNKFQKKLKKDQSETKRAALLEKFSSKMKALEDELAEEQKKDTEKLNIMLDMKRQSRRAEREMELKKRERELKEEQAKEVKAVNEKLQVLNDNLQNEQMEEMIKKVQTEDLSGESPSKTKGEGQEAAPAVDPAQELAKQIEENRAREERLRAEGEQKQEEQRKALLAEEQAELKRIEQERANAEKQVQASMAQVKNKKTELNAMLAKAATPAEKKKLLEEFQKYQSEVADHVHNEIVKQNATFEDKIAERKRKRAAKEAEIQAAKDKELEELKKNNRKEEDALKRRIDEQKLQRQIEKMKMMLTQDELPFAVERLIDDMHMNELADLLRRQLHDKAMVLKDNMQKLLKEKAEAVQKVKEDMDSQLGHVKQLADKGLLKKEEYMAKLEDLKERKEKALKDAEYDYAQKQNELEEQKLMEVEKTNSEELVQLMKTQSNEKQMYMQAFVSDEFLKKILSGDKAVMDKALAAYEKEVMEAYAKRNREIEEKRKKIEEILLKDSDKIKELEAQAQKMLEEQEMREKMREEKNKKMIQEKLASKEEELQQKGITEDEKRKMLEEHQKELDALIETMEKERGRQRENITGRIQDKLKQKEMLKKQREEQISLMQKEEEKLLDAKVKEIQKEKGIETEEEKGNLAQLSKKYDPIKMVFEKMKPLAGVDLEPEKSEENVLKGILESKKKTAREPSKIDLSFELLFDRLRKLETSVNTITGLQFEQIFAGFLDLNTKLENISSGNVPKAQTGKLEALRPDSAEPVEEAPENAEKDEPKPAEEEKKVE